MFYVPYATNVYKKFNKYTDIFAKPTNPTPEPTPSPQPVPPPVYSEYIVLYTDTDIL